VVRQGRRELHGVGFGFAEVHHGGIGRREVRPPDAEAGRSDAAPDPEPHQAWRNSLRTISGIGDNPPAAELTERVCMGIELDPKYVDVIVQRWQTLSGKKAKLDGDGRTFEEIAAERVTVPA
jgi:hypothetical protein